MHKNPYVFHIEKNLPRLLALFDADPTSQSYGMGDRFFWAWGLTDFPNGVFQGAANGLCRLWKNGFWPYSTNEEKFVQRIDSMFVGLERMQARDGCIDQAFPREGSYAGTAFVVYDMLCAIDSLLDNLDQSLLAKWLRIIEPMVRFLCFADETHGIISNHLATAVGALVRWHKLTGEAIVDKKAKILLNTILNNQSNEGWYIEYEGADPGYQSLCMYYLADVHLLRPDLNLLPSLVSATKFLWNFAHPDGSFGGLYGSRCTRFYNPAGIEALASLIPEAAVLSSFMRRSIHEQKVVNLSSIDETNLVPWFNSFCWAAILVEKNKHREAKITDLPCLQKDSNRIFFKNAGLTIDRGPRHYTIISSHKGGVVYHFLDDKKPKINAGVIVENPKQIKGSTQAYSTGNQVENFDNMIIVTSKFSPMPKRLPGPFEFLSLRFLSLTFFRIRTFREIVKRVLVKLLITRKDYWPGKNVRTIYLGENLEIKDNVELPADFKIISATGYFVAIHMASQGYWQIQDEEQEL